MAKKKTFWVIVLVIFSACFLSCTAYLVIDYFHYRSMVHITGSHNDNSNTSAFKKEVQVPVDFDTLTETVNADIYAWIRIPYSDKTNEYFIDYPVLQSPDGVDNSYYLNHNVNGKKSVYGAIYTQNYNRKDFNDFNTLIYGHNMKNGSMFGSLKKYRKQDFFDENRDIEIYMPGRILKYRIFAAYVFDNRHIMLSFDFNDNAERERYLETVYSRKTMYSNFAEDVTVNTDDRIITLSTCTGNDKERYLVQGVLVYDSDTDS